MATRRAGRPRRLHRTSSRTLRAHPGRAAPRGRARARLPRAPRSAARGAHGDRQERARPSARRAARHRHRRPRSGASSSRLDLVGLPVIRDGRTTYAAPSVLPQDGAGILMLEELNRAERYIQQPALQLLSARRLHEYEPPTAGCASRPSTRESADYQVTLDQRCARGSSTSNVRADRACLARLGAGERLHPARSPSRRRHERILDDVRRAPGPMRRTC